MEKWTDDVKRQWEEWTSKNPKESFIDIDEKQLRDTVISELSFVSKMEVKEYTLYQKWCEIQEKFPAEEVSTLFGVEKQLKSLDQKDRIDFVKSNIWIPESPEDYLKLDPIMEYTDDSDNYFITAIDGTKVKEEKKRTKELPERCNIMKTFVSSGRNNSNIGRNLNFVIKDGRTGKYLGVNCLSSDYLDLTPRDKYIGWSKEVKTQGRMINHTCVGSTIIPTQPLGFNYVGGKLLALLCLSDDVQNYWKKVYGDTLIAVTTTSLYGKTKAGGLSQYDNLDHWQAMGFTSGSVSYEPTRKTRKAIENWLKKNHTQKYFEWYVATNPGGQPYKRDHKNRSLYYVYSKLSIPKELTKSEHARGIYFSPLYDNSLQFLRKECTEKDLIKSFDTSTETLVKIWKEKHAKGRIKQLMKKNNVSYQTLFYDDLIYLDWEETKAKYLIQVGR